MTSRRFLVSAAHKSSGKTTVSIGLAAALARRGLVVQPFKKGPDYIDPMWLSKAAGRACRNIDPYLSGRDEIIAAFARHGRGADVCVVEGNKGLHDGMSIDGRDSSAAIARMLALPVVLVLDTRGMTRGIAPLVLGQQAFDREIDIAGVILNRVAGPRHESKLRAAVEHCTDVPVLGALGEDPRLAIVERHLGLMPSSETDDASSIVAAIAAAVEAGVDVDRLLTIDAPRLPNSGFARVAAPSGSRVRIGIARDAAFGFYYQDDVDVFTAAGATLVPFDTLRDARLPDVDALFIGGGFPEAKAARLAANGGLRADIRTRIHAGLPVYAECGGLMYLARSIEWRGERHPMVGALPADVVMNAKPVGRGYVELACTADFPWSGIRSGSTLRAHEFHYSRLANVAPDLRYAYRVLRGHGIDGVRDGIVHRNVLASYTHLRSVGGDDWPRWFVAFVRAQRATSRAPRCREPLAAGAC
jgi:cobyrinic acid a,c-diamide synthase